MTVETLPPIIVQFETPASAVEAWAALTDPVLVAEWFTVATPIGAVGDDYRLDFGDGSVVEGTIRCDDRGFAAGTMIVLPDGSVREEMATS